MKETYRRRREKHLAFYGSDEARLGWDRESDWRVVEEFMRSQEPTLALADPPPGWRMATAWFCVVLGGLGFVGAIQSSFFPKKNAAPART